MKYLLLILAAAAFVSTASAVSRIDCCTGSACCMMNLSCCGE
jgi:hypothetical protein